MDGVADSPEFSIVVPVCDEIDVLDDLRVGITELIDSLDAPAEVVLVDDGSTDGSYEAIVDICRRDPRFCALRLSRNFGQQIAITAGLDHCRGRAVIVMDADLQDPPELVPEMIAKWRQGYQVVYARRRQRCGEGVFKRASAWMFYRLIGWLARIDIPPDTGQFRLIDRSVVKAIRNMPERNRFLQGMFAWAGFSQTPVDFDRPRRTRGKTKYSLRQMCRIAVDGVLSFSAKPLRVALHFGLLVAGVSFVYGMVAIVLKIGPFQTKPGWASIMVVLTFLGGVQLAFLGMLGEYLARVFDEVRRRPLYFIAARHGFDDETQKDRDESAPPRADQGGGD